MEQDRYFRIIYNGDDDSYNLEFMRKDEWIHSIKWRCKGDFVHFTIINEIHKMIALGWELILPPTN